MCDLHPTRSALAKILATAASRVTAAAAVHPHKQSIMATPTKPTSPLTKEQDWADISDDDNSEEAPTVQVDSLDLTSLSIDEKNKDKPAATS